MYGDLFPSDEGCPAKSARMAFGALFIKERLGTSDRETIEQIKENPYLQYFIGIMEYNDEQAPFDSSLMTHFRKRFSQAILSEINEWILHSRQKKAAPRMMNRHPTTRATRAIRP